VTKRIYTTRDVDDLFEELRLLVCAHDDDDPDFEDYCFRMDAVIRFWLLEMTQHTACDAHLFDALQQAFLWAGWQAVFSTETGTIH